MCVCKKGYYNTNSSAESVLCTACPMGTDCSTNGTTMLSLQSAILPGYFRLSNRSAEIRQCPDYRLNDTDSSSCSPVGEPLTDLGCREWTDGPFCHQCNVTDGTRYFSHTTSSCKVCTDNADTPAITATVLFLLFITVVGLVLKFKPHERFPWFHMAFTRALAL